MKNKAIKNTCELCELYQKWLRKKNMDRRRWRAKYAKIDRRGKGCAALEHALKI